MSLIEQFRCAFTKHIATKEAVTELFASDKKIIASTCTRCGAPLQLRRKPGTETQYLILELPFGPIS